MLHPGPSVQAVVVIHEPPKFSSRCGRQTVLSGEEKLSAMKSRLNDIFRVRAGN